MYFLLEINRKKKMSAILAIYVFFALFKKNVCHSIITLYAPLSRVVICIIQYCNISTSCTFSDSVKKPLRSNCRQPRVTLYILHGVEQQIKNSKEQKTRLH